MQNLGLWAPLLVLLPARQRDEGDMVLESRAGTDALQYNLNWELTGDKQNTLEAPRKEWLILTGKECDILVGLKGKEVARWRVSR